MKFLPCITALIFGAATAAQAVTYQASVAIDDTAGALQSLGADLSAEMALITWTVDPNDPPIQSYSTSNSVGNTLPYRSISVEIGGVSWLNSTPSNVDYVNVSDGLNSSSFDYFALTTLTPVSGPNGSQISSMSFSLSGIHTVFSGTTHPTIDELNGLGSANFFLNVRDASGGPTRQIRYGGSHTIVELAPVPLPAGAPLLIGGLGLLAFMRMRRRRQVEPNYSTLPA